MDAEEYSVAEFMTRDITTVGPDVTVAKCAETMQAEHVSSALVSDGHQLRGIITEKDLARKVVAKALDSGKLLTKDVMSSPVITIAPGAHLNKAIQKMGENNVKHLPVIKKGELLGIITAMDIIRVQPSYVELLGTPKRKRLVQTAI